MQETVSTGQAAKLCGVKPDTILKWIKKEQIVAFKTAGGHYRIPREKLTPYLIKNPVTSQTHTANSIQTIHYCWEYHTKEDSSNENCRNCIIFKAKAEKCYLMAGLGTDIGYAQSFCSDSCYECEYFHFINKALLNVLVITEDIELQKRLKANVKDNFMLKFSCCGYETASIIQEFHPDYIIIDKSLTKSSSEEICKHLLKDPRIHGSQIVLATNKSRPENNIPEGICATIHTPFYVSDMEECFQQLRENFLGKLPD